MLVGAPGETWSYRGAVYVCVPMYASWVTARKVEAQNREDYSYFGYSVAISGDNAVIGAPGSSSDANGENSLTRAGSAFIFKRTGEFDWAQEQKLAATDRKADSYFGWSVDMEGGNMVIGARGANTNQYYNFIVNSDFTGINQTHVTDEGAAYVYRKQADNSWMQLHKMTAEDKETGDFFGHAVALNGNYVFAGAPWEADRFGAAYLFNWAEWSDYPHQWTMNFPALNNKYIDEADFEPGATIDEAADITFVYTSSNTEVAEVYQDIADGNKWKIKGVGTTDITAKQGNPDFYNKVAPVTHPFTVEKRIQAITFADINKYIDEPDFEPGASTSSNLPLTYVSSDTEVAEVYQDTADGNK